MTTRTFRLFVSMAAAFLLVPAILSQDFQTRQIGGIGVTIFRDENFRGENATFRQDVPDLRRYNFGDRITSLRVAPGEYWEACEAANYRGRCQVFSGEERDLRRIGWSDRISSLRRVRGPGGGGGGYIPAPPIAKRGIVLYEDPFYRGRSVTITDSTENLRFQNFHDRAESVRVLSGSWEICSEPRYRRCQTVDGDVPQLSSLGMNKKLSSVRFSGWGGGGGGGYPGNPYPERARMVLFESEGYRGRSITLDTASSDLGGFSGRARSVQILSGRWLVCERPGFSGRCREISSSEPDLYNFGGSIRSARPIDNY